MFSTPSTNIFGGATNPMNQNQTQQPQQPPSNIFGGAASLFKPATTTQPSIFGNATQPAAGAAPLFGNTQAQQQNNTSLFGAKPQPMGATNSLGMFGSQGTTNIFNASASNPGAQGTLTASIANPISTDLPIFSLLPPGPRAVDRKSVV